MTDAAVVRLVWAEGADRSLPLPEYRTAGAAGADLCAHLAPEHRSDGLTLAPGERAAVPTGLRIALPEGFEAQVRMRSSLALHDGIFCPNAPGTIDADYRGEVLVIVMNGARRAVTIRHGDRIAQLVVAPVVRVAFVLAELDGTARGAGGFGSTGRAR